MERKYRNEKCFVGIVKKEGYQGVQIFFRNLIVAFGISLFLLKFQSFSSGYCCSDEFRIHILLKISSLRME